MKSSIRRFWRRLAAFVRPGQAEDEMTREIAAHLALVEEDWRRRGLSPEAAKIAAARAMGGVEQAKEIHRDQRSFPWLEDLRRDIPYAIRGLRRHPSFTIAAVLTVALGVGATTAIFSVVNTILLRPLPYRNSDRLVQVAENIATTGADGARWRRRFGLTQGEFVEWRDRSQAFSHLAGVGNLMNGDVQTPEGVVAAPRAIVSPALFEMLGVPAQLGRTLLPEDEQPNATAAVMSAAAWQSLFGNDPSVLGRSVTLNGTPFTIVGVMPPGFDYPERVTMFWTPLAPRPDGAARAFGNFIGLLKPGVSLSAATDEANVIGAALRTPTIPSGYGASTAPAPPPAPATATMGGPPAADQDSAPRPRFEVLSVKDLIVSPIRPALRILTFVVVLVLLIVCANVANLLLARGTARHREIGVRLAIGAGRGRIIRQIITESAVLSLVGGAAGAAVAVGGVHLVKTLATVDTPRLFQLSINLGDGSLLPRVDELGVDVTLLSFATVIALISGVVFGLAPAISMARVNYARTLGVGTSRSEAAQPQRSAVRSFLVVAQVATATTLLIGAGLLVHTFIKLLSVNPGYNPNGVLTFQLTIPQQMSGERLLAVIERVLGQLSADGRVVSAGYTNIAPFLSLTERGGLFVPPGATREQMLDDPLRPQTRIVSHGYLQTLGARLVAGRWLDENDGGSQAFALIVNRTLVERYFGGQNPIGTPVRVFRSPEYVETWEIVGVVEDMVQARLDQEPFPIVFADMRQVLAARAMMPKALQIGQPLPGFPTIAVRTRGSWEALSGELRPLVRAIDPTVGVGSIAPLEALRLGSLVRPRFYAVLVGVFAAVAGALAAIGVYGVLAYIVVQRTHEIGIRMALGAQHGTVLRAIMARGLSLAAAGVIIGLVGAGALTRYLSGMLFDLTPFDVATFTVVAGSFLVVAAVACYVPARRATTIDPIVAVRE
jgi:putative ABC transport system permease protein